MGLTSLAYLNRSGVYSYWDDSWDSKKLYKQYFYGNFFIKTVVQELLKGSFFNLIYFIHPNHSEQPGYLNRYKIINSYFYKNMLFGKVWYLKYQTWLIIIVHYYDTKSVLKNNKPSQYQIKTFIFRKKYNRLRKYQSIKNYNFIF